MGNKRVNYPIVKSRDTDVIVFDRAYPLDEVTEIMPIASRVAYINLADGTHSYQQINPPIVEFTSEEVPYAASYYMGTRTGNWMDQSSLSTKQTGTTLTAYPNMFGDATGWYDLIPCGYGWMYAYLAACVPGPVAGTAQAPCTLIVYLISRTGSVTVHKYPIFLHRFIPDEIVAPFLAGYSSTHAYTEESGTIPPQSSVHSYCLGVSGIVYDDSGYATVYLKVFVHGGLSNSYWDLPCTILGCVGEINFSYAEYLTRVYSFPGGILQYELSTKYLTDEHHGVDIDTLDANQLYYNANCTPLYTKFSRPIYVDKYRNSSSTTTTDRCIRDGIKGIAYGAYSFGETLVANKTTDAEDYLLIFKHKDLTYPLHMVTPGGADLGSIRLNFTDYFDDEFGISIANKYCMIEGSSSSDTFVIRQQLIKIKTETLYTDEIELLLKKNDPVVDSGFTIKDSSFYTLKAESSLDGTYGHYLASWSVLPIVYSGYGGGEVPGVDVNMAYINVYDSLCAKLFSIAGAYSDARLFILDGHIYSNEVYTATPSGVFLGYVGWYPENSFNTVSVDDSETIIPIDTIAGSYLGKFETSNNIPPQYMFVSAMTAENVPKFYQRNPTAGSFIEYSATLPSADITVIRLDDTV